MTSCCISYLRASTRFEVIISIAIPCLLVAFGRPLFCNDFAPIVCYCLLGRHNDSSWGSLLSVFWFKNPGGLIQRIK